ncbi:MAG: group II intron reverse transcriptase/maturase [Chloroflexi bacterium]|uniref:Group II intron reverse transcriptase/maturase n=1 Tax=Candidatus Chlorohelix allophototropha TaxID=3003348 RepID=A0A8T7M4Z7_9CHLR|nr:group II intron reverse transcriptase/maturase [Chloroflexota bacterium]WJW70284.1 group II intron reverse transcriptase/maturase [Chloroflexota bacterium L227-S17]
MQIDNNLANGANTSTDWNMVDWPKAQRMVRNLRQRIFRATCKSNFKKVRSLQKLMLRSQSNRLVSVRQVTQINHGAKTPGLDKVVVKTPAARGKLVDELCQYQTWKAQPAKRVYIAKANGKMRPLGIVSIRDRCLQAIVKNALEPSWESRFEASSYGFRPGRGTHDAMYRIYTLANARSTKKWVLDADISGAFDNICQEYLLNTLGPTPGRELIRQWLKAGYVEKGVFHQTDQGTAQGGVISPLLLNITLHGMEQALGISSSETGYKPSKRALVKYADDLVVFCKTQADAQAAKQELSQWLAERGLSLAEEKTRIVHLTEGFNFLSFNVKHYHKPGTTKTGWKLLIKPSKQAVQKFRNRLKQEWLQFKGKNVKAVLSRLNPIIRGWANYNRTEVAKKCFSDLDRYMYNREVRYVKRSHPKKSWKWLKARYWGKLNLDREDVWVFGDKQTKRYLLKFSWFPIERHILVKGRASPDDPELKDYWKARQTKKIKELIPSKQRLAQKQQGLCLVCRQTLFNEEELHAHHKIAKAKGGKNRYENLSLVHLFCHQQLHAKEKVEDEE